MVVMTEPLVTKPLVSTGSLLRLEPRYRVVVARPEDEIEQVRESIARMAGELGGRVILVVPEKATGVFQKAKDFRQLKGLQARVGPLTLVLCGREYLRTWARRYGFECYASTSVCVRALERKHRLRVSGPLQGDDHLLVEASMETEPLQFVEGVPWWKDEPKLLFFFLMLFLASSVSGVVCGYLLSLIQQNAALSLSFLFS